MKIFNNLGVSTSCKHAPDLQMVMKMPCNIGYIQKPFYNQIKVAKSDKSCNEG